MLKRTVIYEYMIYKRTIYLSWILSAIIRIFFILVSGDNTQKSLTIPVTRENLIFDISVGAKIIKLFLNSLETGDFFFQFHLYILHC